VTNSFFNCFDNNRVRVTRHRASVSESEVDVFVAIDIPDAVSECTVEINRKTAGLLVHPGHRHATEQVLCSIVCSFRFWVSLSKGCKLALIQLSKFLAINHACLLGWVPRRASSLDYCPNP
jgi:hypothetical protein